MALQKGFPGRSASETVSFVKRGRRKEPPILSNDGWIRLKILCSQVMATSRAGPVVDKTSDARLKKQLKLQKLTLANIDGCGKALFTHLTTVKTVGSWNWLAHSNVSVAQVFRGLVVGLELLPAAAADPLIALRAKALALITADNGKKGKASGLVMLNKTKKQKKIVLLR